MTFQVLNPVLFQVLNSMSFLVLFQVLNPNPVVSGVVSGVEPVCFRC